MDIKRIKRHKYLNKLISFKDKQLIKVVTGVRRCGKSTLLEMFRDYLRESGVADNQIISINLENYDFSDLLDPKQLHAYIKERLVKDRMTYVFIDEVQNCTDFPRVVDSLHIIDNIDIYLTGSNAHMLSSEIATMISGRYVEISMLPLSFKEYVASTGNINNLSEKYKEYIENSSFPYSLAFKGQRSALVDYLNGIYDSIIIKDISQRKTITDTMMLRSVTEFVLDNIGNQLSTKKIADTMTSGGRKIDVRTVEKYVDALRESFIVYQAKRYDIKGKQYLKTLDKYYVVDIGLRHAILGSRSVDVGHILENIVYLDLLRRGYDVYVGKVSGLEVDFVAINEYGREYYQVAATVRDQETLRRELTPLQKISDNYPKYILTLDADPDADYEGIRRTNVLEWLIDVGKWHIPDGDYPFIPYLPGFDYENFRYNKEESRR